MYFNSIAFAAICTMFAVAIAQVAVPWWSSLPACGVKCANLAAANASCNVSDLKCLCNSTTFLNIFEACVGATCPIPVNTSDPVSVFSKDCKSIDWTWGFSPCIRNCALKSATAIGCDMYVVEPQRFTLLTLLLLNVETTKHASARIIQHS
ncbi:hypothetical protein BDZ97DRAFT_354613 [Flammula alnicola]|nr:hypothetical protein BDZ97DRAFT_354613 [Flammula alnicola]